MYLKIASISWFPLPQVLGAQMQNSVETKQDQNVASVGGLGAIDLAKTNTFYAHSTSDDPSTWERLVCHLLKTAARAGQFSAPFGAKAWGRAAGILHDYGKFQEGFQARLRGSTNRVEHAHCGGLIATEVYGEAVGRCLAYTITGHHAGLPNCDDRNGEKTSLRDKLLRAASDLDDIPSKDLLLKVPETQLSLNAFMQPVPSLPGFSLQLFVRMIFSALCDADFLCTERFYDYRKTALRQIKAPDFRALSQILQDYVSGLGCSINVEKPSLKAQRILNARNDIFQRCLESAKGSPGVYSLTVPTGGGKTFASLAFGLEHAAHHNKRRVIYAIPYTSIIDQTADNFRSALTGYENLILEHHSAVEERDEELRIGKLKRKLATENWDAPIVVTSTVQFFESLFAARPGKCRKLHNIANSVIVLDEVQSLPLPFLKPCVAALQELCRGYGCTVLLCTATQPDLRHERLGGILQQPHEIVADIPELFSKFNRVQSHYIPHLSDEELVEHLATKRQALCIVDQRLHARDLHAALSASEALESNAVFHLSAGMCPNHRRATLDAVKLRLKQQAPCHLIATQVVEAGVDLSFPTVFRAEAGIDSLAQAAGRCNRHGEAEEGELYVFGIDRTLDVPDLKKRRELARPLLIKGWNPLGQDTVHTYFSNVFTVENTDKYGILDLCENTAGDLAWQFQDIAEAFRIIPDVTTPVIVPWGNHEELCLQLETRLRQGIPPDLDTILRPLQQISISVYPHHLSILKEAGALSVIGGDERFLRLVDTRFYSPDRGLDIPSTGQKFERYIL